MTRKKKNLLRPITEEEQIWLERISRSQSEAAGHVSRAKEILAIAVVIAKPKQPKRRGRNREMRYRNWWNGSIKRDWQ
jgi:hypothetical protein